MTFSPSLFATTVIFTATVVAAGSASPVKAQDEEYAELVSPALEAWRGYKQEKVPSSWRVVGDELIFTPTEDGRGDLITREQFQDFELRLEWRVGPAGNSGIFFRVSEDQPATYNTGAEMQILDNALHVDGKNPPHFCRVKLCLASAQPRRHSTRW